MPSDLELLIERNTLYADIPVDSQVANLLAEKYGLSRDSIRGRLSSAGNRLDYRLALAKYLRDSYTPDLSIERQKAIIADSTAVYESLQKQDKPEYTAVFISDKHNPYYREDAWELTCTILDDMPDVDYITVQNDWNDNRGFGRWDDNTRGAERVFTDDIAHTRNMEANDYRTLKTVQPSATMLALMGNHDKWWYNNKRITSPQDAEKTILDYMEWLQDFGILQFSRGLHENVIRLSPALVFAHGKWASKSPIANARNAVKAFTDRGMSSSVIMGHTHRISIVEGHSIGIPGIRVINNGCLCTNEAEYLPYGKSNTWGMGITVCHFNPKDRDVDIYPIRYETLRGELVARYNGQRYSVSLT